MQSHALPRLWLGSYTPEERYTVPEIQVRAVVVVVAAVVVVCCGCGCSL